MARLIALSCVLMALLVPESGSAQGPDYILHIIPPLGSGTTNEAYAYDVNSSGQVVGRSIGSTNSGFVWSPTTGTVPVPAAGRSIAEDGSYAAGNGIYSATGQLLQTVPPNAAMTAIRPACIRSGAGLLVGPVVVGRSFDPTVSAGPSSCFDCIAHLANAAFVYDPVNGTRNLDTLGVPDSFWAMDITAAGLVVGNTNNGTHDHDTRAFVFDLATGVGALDLGTLRPDNLGIASAEGVNDAGQVVGYAMTAFLGDEHAFLWTSGGGMADLGTLGPSAGIGLNRSRAYDINASGVVVGDSNSPNTQHPLAIRRAFVWDASHGMRDLNDLAVTPSGYELVRATAISDSGWICGYGVGSAGQGFYSGWVLEPIASVSPSFVRGDCSGDVAVNIADAVAALALLFSAGSTHCQDACDANDDGNLNIADPITLLAALFSGGAPLPAPTLCGADTTASALTCLAPTPCP